MAAASRKQLLRERVYRAQAKLEGAQAFATMGRQTDFWRECVRDTTGRWRKYADVASRTGVRYFHGVQSVIDYTNQREVRYQANNMAARAIWYNALMSVDHMDPSQFQALVERLRRALSYRPTETWYHETLITPQHTPVVLGDVLPLAQVYNDPYALGMASGPVFAGFPLEALPKDVAQGDLIYHHYPDIRYKDYYLAEALASLQRILFELPFGSPEYIRQVAYFYQVILNLHLFAAQNASLYTNMANGLLELAALPTLEHGIMDFIALRVQPETFQRYFTDEIAMQHIDQHAIVAYS